MPKHSKITDEIIQICADNVRLGLSYSACAKAIGVTYQTWNNWTKLGQDGKYPYSKWLIAIQQAETDLFKECLESVKLSMKLGDVKSAYFLLQSRFSSEGYGRKESVQVDQRSVNLNVNADISAEERRKEIVSFMEKIRPKNTVLSEDQ